MEHIEVKSFGPIGNVSVELGDLTLLIGPQASGKSIFLQLVKLLMDKKHILYTLNQYNYIWNKNPTNILEVYFGDGMSKIWEDKSQIKIDGKSFCRDSLLGAYTKPVSETMFYIPAQRILSIADGRPKNFMEFDNSTPYVLRYFSETLRLFMQNGMGNPETIFPIKNRLKAALRCSFNNSIFHDGRVIMEEQMGQRKMRMEINGLSVPFMTWSAGQKEFMPLLLGFYCLLGPKSRVIDGRTYDYVIIEEPEMGLHPEAIKSVIIQIIELISRGYKVIVSTHSPVFLEFAWVFNALKKIKASNIDDSLYELFDMRQSPATHQLFDGLFQKQIKTFFFSRPNNKTVMSQDISDLDAGSNDASISEWGGISQFASKAADILSKYYYAE